MAKLPGFYRKFLEQYPAVGDAYNALGEACKTAGPLDAKTAELVKLGISIAASLEGGTHAHTRKALEAGAEPAEIRHVVLMATTTVGFPGMMRGLAWVEDVLNTQ